MINWREIPFVRLLAPFIAGILLAPFTIFNPLILQSLLVALLAFAILLGRIRGWYRYRWIYGMVLSAVLLLAGVERTYTHDERNDDQHFAQYLSGAENIVTGTVSVAPAVKENWVKVQLAVSRSGPSADSLLSGTGNILLYLRRDSAAENVQYGDEIAFKGKIFPVPPPGNPHAFDYRRYLHFQNIHYQAFINRSDWQVAVRSMGNPVLAVALKLQKRFLVILEKHLAGESERSVGSALILGYRDDIPEEVRTAYSETGAMHVLAVSGLHVGIVFMILNFFLVQIRINKALWRVGKVVIILFGIWAFALVTGASPSVVRAAVMFSFLNIGLAFYRYTNIYNTLAASAFLLLFFNPFLLHNVSFQLSYLAVLGIVYFQPKIARLWIIENKSGNYIWQLVCVSLAAQLMILPLTFYYFNQFPTYFWLTSLILVPLAGVELCAGLSLFVLDAVWAPGAPVVGKLLDLLLLFGNECVFRISRLPAAVVEGIWIGGAVVLLLYGIIAVSMLAISSRKYKWVLSGLVLATVVSMNYGFTSLQHYRQRQWVVYSINRHTAIDLFDGKQVISMASDGIDEKSLDFAARGHRYAMGMEKLNAVSLSDTTEYIFDNCFIKNSFVNFYGCRIAIVDKMPAWTPDRKIPIDYLIILSSPDVSLKTCLSRFEIKEKVIFDATNKFWQVKKWKKACENLKLDYHDVAQNGAFVMDLPE